MTPKPQFFEKAKKAMGDYTLAYSKIQAFLFEIFEQTS
jgi:hypothetical protein